MPAFHGFCNQYGRIKHKYFPSDNIFDDDMYVWLDIIEEKLGLTFEIYFHDGRSFQFFFEGDRIKKEDELRQFIIDCLKKLHEVAIDYENSKLGELNELQ